ncbi:DUF4112 domain-containing protein [Haloarchaeobius sp. HRN-SO-5]|uniref:DUF4112 domain-containing protein n=1 Tax=Haloarchaeobius sp. HRN-SO-5 TaxID=3446118 RepID=UPI003EBF3039
MPVREPSHPAVRRTEQVSWLLDEAIRIPGTKRRIGLDTMVGLLPVAGDVVTAIVSLYIVVEAWIAGARKRVLGRMLVNVLVDVTVGSAPVVGDVFDAVWKANVRNQELLERELSETE